jgi:hypothetical protein
VVDLSRAEAYVVYASFVTCLCGRHDAVVEHVVRDPVYAGKLAFSYSPAGASTVAHQNYMAREVVKLMWWGPAKTHGMGYMDLWRLRVPRGSACATV